MQMPDTNINPDTINDTQSDTQPTSPTPPTPNTTNNKEDTNG